MAGPTRCFPEYRGSRAAPSAIAGATLFRLWCGIRELANPPVDDRIPVLFAIRKFLAHLAEFALLSLKLLHQILQIGDAGRNPFQFHATHLGANFELLVQRSPYCLHVCRRGCAGLGQLAHFAIQFRISLAQAFELLRRDRGAGSWWSKSRPVARTIRRRVATWLARARARAVGSLAMRPRSLTIGARPIRSGAIWTLTFGARSTSLRRRTTRSPWARFTFRARRPRSLDRAVRATRATVAFRRRQLVGVNPRFLLGGAKFAFKFVQHRPDHLFNALPNTGRDTFVMRGRPAQPDESSLQFGPEHAHPHHVAILAKHVRRTESLTGRLGRRLTRNMLRSGAAARLARRLSQRDSGADRKRANNQ